MSTPEIEAEIAQALHRARRAQEFIADYDQAQVDDLVACVAWAVARKDNSEKLAQIAVEETGLGNYPDKVLRTAKRVTGVLADIRPLRTVGVVEEDPARGLVKIAKPVGVVGAAIPLTAPEAAPAVKALLALKGRNALIAVGHPRGQRSTKAVVDIMRDACQEAGAPRDLVQVIENPSIAKTKELMRQVDLVVATGGSELVHAAYSSGTPAYGVGVGNSVHVVDETADLDDAAAMIAAAKTFDYGTSCLADNAVVVAEVIYDALLDKLIGEGGYLCSAQEKNSLQQVMWPDGGERPCAAVIGKSAQHIAGLAGLQIPDERSFLIVPETDAGPGHPFSGEKLSVVLALYRYGDDFGEAVQLVNAITNYQGLGHTCGIHTNDGSHVEALATRTKTSRVVVNQNLNEGAGSLRNGLPFTLSLSCGTWGGNITSENVNAKHFINTTWVSWPTAMRSINEDEVFAGSTRN